MLLGFIFTLNGCGIIERNSSEYHEFRYNEGIVLVSTYFGQKHCISRLTGKVTKGLKENLLKVNQFLQDAKCLDKEIILISQGGDVASAMEAGRVLHDAEFDTKIDTQCDSACTILFIAGKNRRMIFTGSLGFHQLKNSKGTCVTYAAAKNSLSTKAVLDSYFKYIREMLPKEISEKFIELAMQYSCDEIKRLTPSGSKEHGFATEANVLW